MAGLYDTDIRLDDAWQLTQGANGDAPLISGTDCLLQDIRLEALTQEGELFYNKEYGWSLLDFVQRDPDDGMTILEIQERVKSKLSRRPEVDADSITVDISFSNDILYITATFSFIGVSGKYNVTVGLDRVNVEVVAA